MSNLNDLILSVTGGPSINEGLLTHYQGRGATSDKLEDAEREYLLAAGATPSIHNQDMWFELLRAAGYIGKINDMLEQFWDIGGGEFGPLTAPVFDGTGWPASWVATEEASFLFNARPFFTGAVTTWALLGDVPAWLNINASGVMTGTPPFGDRDYGNITVRATNGAGSDDATPIPLTTPANVAITLDPISVYGEVGGAVTFSVGATDSTGYQWYRNTQVIPGATGQAYTTPAIDYNRDGDEYFCRVSGEDITRDTAIATLTVMEVYNNLDDGSGSDPRTVTLAVGSYNLSMRGGGRVELSENTANIAEI